MRIHLLLALLLALLTGCAPTLQGDDDDAVADDDDTTSDDDDATADDDDATAGGLAFGTGCGTDEQCQSGVCWDWADYDPWCGGMICSDRCESDEQCWEWADIAGASDPAGAACGEDGLCVLVGTGLGDFWCADGLGGE